MKAIKILLVEDDKLDVIDIERSLGRINILYQLRAVKNGEEAIQLLKEDTATGKDLPDLLLIDINMPKMDGLELLQLIRNQPEWKSLRCFIITTSSERADRKAAEKLGISGFIIKPLKLNSPSNIDVFNLMIDLMNFKSLEGGS